MAWKVFVEKQRGRTPTAWAGIRIHHIKGNNKEGCFQLTFSSAVMSKFHLKSGDFCRLLIDDAKKLILIQKCGPMEGYKTYSAKNRKTSNSCGFKWTCAAEKTKQCKSILIGSKDQDKRYVPLNELTFDKEGILLQYA